MTAPVLLLDGYSLLFRAHHALPPMSTGAGAATSAMYGFSALLIELLREERPAGLAIALDAPGGKFRNVAYPGSLRAPMWTSVTDLTALRAAFEVLEFRRLLTRLDAVGR